MDLRPSRLVAAADTTVVDDSTATEDTTASDDAATEDDCPHDGSSSDTTTDSAVDASGL